MRKLLLILCLLFLSFSGYGYERRDTVLTTMVCFDVGTTRITKGDKGYDYYLNEMLPYMYDHSDELELVSFYGSTSPEGPRKLNDRLAKGRVEVLSKDLHINPNKIYVEYFSENFTWLYEMVDSTKQQSLSAIYEDEDIKSKITTVPFYDDLTSNVYPQLRSVKVEMAFRKKECPSIIDTVYIRDTIYHYDIYTQLDTIYIREKPRTIPILAVKTNVAADAVITPNVQAELYTWLWGLSLEFDYTFPWYHKDYDSYFYYQILNGTAGIRKYFNNKYYGHWIGIYANTGIYDICFWNKDKGWQGEVYGAGLGYGYVFRHKKYPRLKFEPYIRVGWFNTKFDKYHASQPWNEKYYYDWYLRASDFVPRRFNMNYFGPTEVGFNLTFDLICIRKY